MSWARGHSIPRVLLCRLPPMHIVLLTGHTREHVISEEPMTSVLFDSIMEKPMQHESLRTLIEQVHRTKHCITTLMQPTCMCLFTKTKKN